MATTTDFKVKNSLVVRNTATISNLDNIQTVSASIVSSPTLNLSFNSPSIDPRIAFTRSSGATFVGLDGFIKYAGLNVPRVEYSSTSTGTCVGLLIEEQRTNLLPSSSQFSGWNNNTNLPIYDNSMISPDGTMSAAITNSVGGGTRYKGTSSAATSGTYYTYSIYFKPTDATRTFKCYVDGNIGAGNTFNAASADVVPSTNAVTLGGLASTGTVEFVGNGWYRMSVTFIPLSANALNCHVFPLNADLTGWWGAQTEQGIFATSYIPTTTSQVTRAADRCLLTPGPWYSPNIGTWYASFQGGRESTQGFYGRVLSPSGATTILSTGDSANTSIVSSWAGGLSIFLTTAQDFWTTPGGAALSYNNTTLTRSLSARGLISTGNYTVSDASNYIISTAIGIGQNAGGATNMLNGHITRIMYWPAVLTNTQLQALTTASTFADADFASKSTTTSAIANTSNFIVKQGVVVGKNLEVPDIDKYYITSLTKPTQVPSLNLNFLKGTLDSRISFTRTSGATIVGANGYIQYVGNNVPRIDYSSTSTGTCLGLLVEEQRTNLALYSGQMIPSLWSYGPNSTYIGTAIAPDGSSTAASVTANGSGGNEYVSKSITYSSSTVYTASVWARLESGTVPASGTILSIGYSNTSTTSTTVRSVINYNGNLTSNWQRFSTTFTNVLGGTYSAYFIADQTNTSTIQVWGAQIEQGTFATSYIPTGASQATRAVDLATINGQNFQSWYRQDQGTLLVEADSIASTVDEASKYRWIAAISQGVGQKIGIYKNVGSYSIMPKLVNDVYTSKFEPVIGTASTGTIFKAAVSYQNGSQVASFNGATTIIGSGTDVPSTLVDNLRIGNGDAPWCGHIRRVVFYPEKLSNTVTQSITVI